MEVRNKSEQAGEYYIIRNFLRHTLLTDELHAAKPFLIS
jgi:hypothetical protein